MKYRGFDQDTQPQRGLKRSTEVKKQQEDFYSLCVVVVVVLLKG